MTKFEEFISQLSEQLKAPLPGLAAQLKLEPATRRNYPLDPVAAKARLSSILILFFPEAGKTKVVLIQRPEYNGVHSGQIAFPGGKKEESDKSIIDTALRETFEEVGVDPKRIKIIGKLSELYIPPSNFLVEPFIGYINERPNFIAEPSEVSELVLVDLDDLLDEASLQKREIPVRGMKAEVPCYFVNEKVIWGATSMIISELLEVIKRK